MLHASPRAILSHDGVDELATAVGEQHAPMVTVVLGLPVQHLDRAARRIPLVHEEICEHRTRARAQEE
jgi:hypothetical protein